MWRRHSAGEESFEVSLPAGWDEVALAVRIHAMRDEVIPRLPVQSTSLEIDGRRARSPHGRGTQATLLDGCRREGRRQGPRSA